jgi:uncharacterized protein (TIGR02284 family)
MAERTELNVLDHLLETCRDGESGLRFAADHAIDPDVRDLFTTLADERGGFARELTPHVHRLGGQANSDGTAAGAIHRRWMSLKGAVSRHHDHALLAEAERGERAAIEAYGGALAGMLPPTVSDLVDRQLAGIREALGRIVAVEGAEQKEQR